MIIDLFIIFPVVALSVLGFKDGLVKKGIALVVTFIALIAAQLLLDDMAHFFVDEFDTEPGIAPIYGFFTVFFGLIFLQSIIYRLTGQGYHIGGLADRFVGSFLGVFQGIVIMSAIFMMLTLVRFPSRTYRVDSRLYKTVLNVAPQILDFTINVVPETTGELKEKTQEQLHDLTKPDRPPATTQRPQPKPQQQPPPQKK